MLQKQISEPEFGNTKAQIRPNDRKYVYIRNLVDTLALCDEFTGKNAMVPKKKYVCLYFNLVTEALLDMGDDDTPHCIICALAFYVTLKLSRSFSKDEV